MGGSTLLSICMAFCFCTLLASSYDSSGPETTTELGETATNDMETTTFTEGDQIDEDNSEKLSSKTPNTSCGLPAKTPCLPSPSTNSQCPKHKIVGGREALPNSYPWQVALLTRSGSFFCGGSIVDDQWIITAAHCVHESTAANVKVLAGAHRLNSRNKVAVSQVIVHPGYNPDTMNNDLALLKLSKKLTFNANISAVCVAKTSDGEVGITTPVVATGWGTMGNGELATVLQEVQLSLTTNTLCNNAYGGGITAQMICAHGPGKDTCQGDSGGPLVYRNPRTGRLTLIGATSFGEGCADPKFPGVYARVSAFNSWISSYIPNL